MNQRIVRGAEQGVEALSRLLEPFRQHLRTLIWAAIGVVVLIFFPLITVLLVLGLVLQNPILLYSAAGLFVVQGVLIGMAFGFRGEVQETLDATHSLDDLSSFALDKAFEAMLELVFTVSGVIALLAVAAGVGAYFSKEVWLWVVAAVGLAVALLVLGCGLALFFILRSVLRKRLASAIERARRGGPTGSGGQISGMA